MSFTADVKKELTGREPGRKCCTLAELSGFLRFAATFSTGEATSVLRMVTEHPAVARAMIVKIKSSFDLKTALAIKEINPLSGGRVYELIIADRQSVEKVLKATGLGRLEGGVIQPAGGLPRDLMRRRCCRKAMLRGIFMAAGSISDPEKSYHLEIVCREEELAKEVRRLINSFGLKSRYTKRKQRYVVYIKESDQIIDFLNILGAHGQLFRYEDVRITKELRNRTNRISNCDNANFDRTVAASLRQLAHIRTIEDKGGLETLPPKLKETALMRLAHPEVSLSELAEMFDPPLKKSGLSHRFNALARWSERMEEE